MSGIIMIGLDLAKTVFVAFGASSVQAMGLIPPAYVQPFVKHQKNAIAMREVIYFSKIGH